MALRKPLCVKCAYFYTSWDKHFPYGCKAMGVKSAQSPADVVKQASGQECLAYIQKCVIHGK